MTGTNPIFERYDRAVDEEIKRLQKAAKRDRRGLVGTAAIAATETAVVIVLLLGIFMRWW